MPYYDKDSLDIKELPGRSRVIIVGGGIHGVGLSHDLASRGWRDTLLLEQNTLGSGTSTWSTKLIHGGLRYLQNPRQFSLVQESLRERKLLCELAPDIVKPLPLIYPIRKKGGRSPYVVRSGLWLYDRLAGKRNLHKHLPMNTAELEATLVGFNTELFSRGFTFWDAQTDDQRLVIRVASSAVRLGATLAEGVCVRKIEHTEHGMSLQVQDSKGHQRRLSALYVVLATGPWSHELLQRSQIKPRVEAVKNRGSHLLVDDIGLKVGLFLESPRRRDRRIFFALPWGGYTLIGTTEVLHSAAADQQRPSEQEIDELLEHFNAYRCEKISRKNIRYVFSGLRWLPCAEEGGDDLSNLSRESLLHFQRGSGGSGGLWTIYGGKLTGYRLLARDLADQVLREFGTLSPSCTHRPELWAREGEDIKDAQPYEQRFIKIHAASQ